MTEVVYNLGGERAGGVVSHGHGVQELFSDLCDGSKAVSGYEREPMLDGPPDAYQLCCVDVWGGVVGGGIYS